MRRAAAVAIVLLALLPAFSVAWRFQAMPHLGLHHDDSLYWVGAQSIAHGSYRIESLPGAPFQTKYPPLYPAMLSIAWPSLTAAMWLNWALLPLMLLLSALYFRRLGFNDWQMALLCSWMALAPMTVVLSTTFMSELLCTVLLLVAFLLTGVFGGLAFLSRSVALPAILPLLWKRKYAGVIAIAVAFVGWQVWVKTHQSSGQDLVTLYYTNYLGFHLKHVNLSNLPRLLWVNLDGFLTGTGRLLWPNLSEDPISVQLARLVTIGSILGAVRLGKRTGEWQFAIFAAGMSVMLLLWHYAPSPRFVYPMIPILVAGFLSEAMHVAQMSRESWRKAKRGDRVVIVGIVLLLGCYGLSFPWFLYQGSVNLVPDIYEERAMFARQNEAAYKWIRENTPADAKFLAYDDVLLYLHTGRKAVNRPTPPDLQFLHDNEGIRKHLEGTAEYLKEAGIDYAFVTDSDYFRDLHYDAIKPLRKSLEGSFRLAYEGRGFRIYASDHVPK